MSEEGGGKIRKSGATAHTGIPLPASPSAAEATAPAPAASAPTPPPSIPPCYPVAAASVAQTKALKIEPLPCCGIGFGWFLFIIGFFLPAITWYVGAFVHLFVRIDPREKPGYVACSIAAGFAAIATMIGAIQQLANW